jgi:hypothetical protein
MAIIASALEHENSLTFIALATETSAYSVVPLVRGEFPSENLETQIHKLTRVRMGRCLLTFDAIVTRSQCRNSSAVLFDFTSDVMGGNESAAAGASSSRDGRQRLSDDDGNGRGEGEVDCWRRNKGANVIIYEAAELQLVTSDVRDRKP